ncbi:MAG: hypothetical protein AAFV43_01485 [Planctomycetota bacterium]
MDAATEALSDRPLGRPNQEPSDHLRSAQFVGLALMGSALLTLVAFLIAPRVLERFVQTATADEVTFVVHTAVTINDSDAVRWSRRISITNGSERPATNVELRLFAKSNPDCQWDCEAPFRELPPESASHAIVIPAIAPGATVTVRATRILSPSPVMRDFRLGFIGDARSTQEFLERFAYSRGDSVVGRPTVVVQGREAVEDTDSRSHSWKGLSDVETSP